MSECRDPQSPRTIRRLSILHLRRSSFRLLPSYEEVSTDKAAFAAMTRMIHLETNPYNARRLVQYHGREAVVVNPPGLAAGAGGDRPRLRPAVHAAAAPELRPRSGFRRSRW